MSVFTDLLQPGHPSGVVLGVAGAAAQLRAAGWHVVQTDAATKAGVLDACARGFAFPSYFGHNLDALLDCLRDLSKPSALVWNGASAMHVNHPQDYAKLIEVFGYRVDERPGFAVVLAG